MLENDIALYITKIILDSLASNIKSLPIMVENACKVWILMINQQHSNIHRQTESGYVEEHQNLQTFHGHKAISKQHFNG